jgi:zinc-ribbon domain
VAKQCTHCGEELLKDDAQFCTRCGMLVAPPPTMPEKGRMEKPLSSPPIVREGYGLREQIAQQPISKPSSLPPEHPGWMNALGRDRAPLTPQPSIVPPSRELRVKVWEQQDDSITLPQPESSASAFEQKGLAESVPIPLTDLADKRVPRADIEDLPTHVFPVTSQPSLPKSMPKKGISPRSEPGNLPIEELPTNSIPLTPAQRDVLGDRSSGSPLPRNIDEIAHLDTAMLPASLVNKPASLPGFQNPPVLASQPKLQTSTPPASLPGFQAQVAPPVARKRGRKPLMGVLLAGLCLLLLAGGVWTYIARPFSVAPVTQPWQEFRSTDLGVAMQYPTGWSVSVPGKGNVSLHDSSNTAMFNISIADVNGNDPTHVLQQQVNKLNVTNVKTLNPLPFAGIHWLRQQGSVQINGATYTITLLAAAHGKSFYMLEQIAAQNVSTDYEQTIFVPMRASVHFL